MFSRAYIVCRSDHFTSFSILWSCLIFKVESRCLSYISRIHWHFTVLLSAWNLFTVVFRMFCLESALLREPVSHPQDFLAAPCLALPICLQIVSFSLLETCLQRPVWILANYEATTVDGYRCAINTTLSLPNSCWQNDCYCLRSGLLFLRQF